MLSELIIGTGKEFFSCNSKDVKKRLEVYANMEIETNLENMGKNPRVIIVREEIDKYLCKNIAEEELRAFREDGTNYFGIFGYWGAVRTLKYLDERKDRGLLK